ncbi:spermatogenesis-associated protein 33 isoform X2 [Monodelphis domestica]|uniref:spermatogenesis-associated protein 33 isoform X2 n=1 Tax=Monodelphis domestica TaxID=13616 RepID=UPI0007B3FDD4|nr:spermatogenesis-associated protein 33 isoform X2 [Monodelphis domestica]
MNPLMGLNKSKTKSVKNTQDQGKGKRPENPPKKSLEKGAPKIEGTPARVKTSLKSTQNMSIAEKASMSKDSEPRPVTVPKIIVTRASKDSVQSIRPDVQRTIKEKTDYCPMYGNATPGPYPSPGKSSSSVKKPKRV